MITISPSTQLTALVAMIAARAAARRRARAKSRTLKITGLNGLNN